MEMKLAACLAALPCAAPGQEPDLAHPCTSVARLTPTPFVMELRGAPTVRWS